MSLRSYLASVFFLLCSFLAGCSQTAVLNQIASPVGTMAAMVPAGEARSVKIVGAQKLYGKDVTKLILTYEYGFGQGWLLAHVAVREKDGVRSVTSFNVQARSQSLADEFRFSMAGKGFSHYLFLALVLAAVALTLAALAVCVRMRPLRRKWLWILFIVVGFCRFTIDWNTGAVVFVPLQLQLLSAMAVQPPAGPWTISFAIPLGAIVFVAYALKREEQLAAG